MHLLANDRWSAVMPLERIGRYQFAVEAWIDAYGTFVRDLTRKREAAVDLALDVREGQQLLEAARRGASGSCGEALGAILAGFEALPENQRAGLLVAPETVELMRRADPRAFRARSKTYSVESERIEARFASWYELFPRSQSGDPARHGTFRDVIARLPRNPRRWASTCSTSRPSIPIGRTNRKGRNNALKAGAGDPGSVYAIGSARRRPRRHPSRTRHAGGFPRACIAAAHEHGLEIALDFAVQCSPDHPWLKQHPGWFDWRPDGTIKYAENPPKKYEDIVNVDFYAEDAVPDLWLALRDIVRVLDRARACASSGSTIRTPSRSRSGNG